jgi:quinol-cytochrome oxidoreductase complex cytochrome b subunit
VINFYALHTTVVPVLLVGLMALHFWRVRKAGGIVDPDAGGTAAKPTRERVLFLPELLMRETAVALALLAFVLVLAIGLGAPLGEAANAGMSPDPAKAPWYFLGFQELLFHFHPFFAVVVIPLVAAVALALLPYLSYDGEIAGPWFLTEKGRRMGVFAALVALVVTPLWIVVDELVIDAAAWFPAVPAMLRDGLIPFGLLLAAIVAFHRALTRRFTPTRSESVQALFILLAVAFVELTATGIWFRGTGMALTWPWNL